MSRQAIPTDPRRILLIKPSALGDIVHALPILNLIHLRWPTAQITWLVTPAFAGLLRGHPMISELMIFDRKHYAQSWWNPKAMLDWRQFKRSLRQSNFDLVIDLQGLFRSGFLSFQTGAACRVGFEDAREGGWVFYTHRVRVDTWDQHAIGRYLKITRALGCPDGPIEFPFVIDDADRVSVRQLLANIGNYAVLLPGTIWNTKRWPVERFAALVQPLRQQFGMESVVAGGPADGALGRQIPGVDLTGKTNLRQLVALLEGAALVIANDSGPMHIAAALGRPLVTVFGPTNPLRNGPYGREDCVVRTDIPCSPCYSRTCRHHSCMRWMMIETVLQAARRQLGAVPLPR